MKSFDLHIYFDREGRARAKATLDGLERLGPTELRDAEVSMLADIATRCACAEVPPKEECA